MRPEEGSFAPEAFRNRFQLCRPSPNHIPAVTAAEDHVLSHIVQCVQERDARSVTARKVNGDSQRHSGSD
jgi:hypothetical protein